LPRPRHPQFLDRFTGRAGDYAKYRPTYPGGIISFLEDRIGFDRTCVVADIGSGTGILSELFLKNGNRVYCVEPNKDMRRVAEKSLAKYGPLFISVDGAAEATKLKPGSVDLVVAGQALHWFDLHGARSEFGRILRKNGRVAIIYNHRKKGGRLEAAYDKVVEKHRRNRPPIPDANDAYISKFLGVRKHDKLVLPNSQDLSLDGILGRLASASYMPARGTQRWSAIERDAKKIVEEYGSDGVVELRYDTTVYLGKIARRQPESHVS
jgi:SAM-dependent methyltransferase